MNRVKISIRKWLLCGLLCCSGVVSAQPDSALQWLKKIGEAQSSLNYYGTFVYAHGDRLESMKVVHASGKDGERERLIHLNGAAREIIRNNDLVTSIFPEQKQVLVAHRRNLTTSPFVQPESLSVFEAHYNLSLGIKERVAGVVTQRIDLNPKDIYRYGYRFWISPEGLLLRSDLLDGNGIVIERIMFTDIHLVEKISHELMSPKLDMTDFQWFRQQPPISLDETLEHDWRIDDLPEGFSVKSRMLRSGEKEGEQVEHLQITDGLASISVFIEDMSSSANARLGEFRVGALNGFGRVVDQHVVIVVGDVPVATVQRIAESVVNYD